MSPPRHQSTFRALLIREPGPGHCQTVTLDEDALPEGEVTVAVQYSSLNYKDALAVTGQSPVIRHFPMVPGIDLAGVVTHSTNERWQPGDTVIVTGCGLGETHWGGMTQRARPPTECLVRLPAGLSARQAMIIGTAGFTAMLAVLTLQRQGVQPGDGEILVTGASGGVGSFAIALLAREGHTVTASTGRPENTDYLRTLGASDIIDRRTLSEPGKPLGKARWAGVIDVLGSHSLANACATTRPNGVVAACGLAQGMDFPATVAPFILRGITLCGINSVAVPAERRQQAWQRLAKLLDPAVIERIGAGEIGLDQVVDTSHELLAGTLRGRRLVVL